MSKHQDDSFGVAAARVAVIFLLISALIAGLWIGLLTPANNQRKQALGNIKATETELARMGLLLDQDSLRRELNKEINYNSAILEEWSNTVVRLNGFPTLPNIPAEKIGKIDYKVALFDTKQRLLKKARALNINLTSDIGLDAVVRSSEDARRLMYQLKAVETLLDTALDMKIDTVKFVEPLAPKGYHPEESDEIFVEEYPVRIRMYGDLDSLYDLLSSALVSENFLVLKNLRVRSVSESKPDLLDISAVMSSLLFIKSPETMDTIKNAIAPVKISPRGH
jgi:hypothetical protein